MNKRGKNRIVEDIYATIDAFIISKEGYKVIWFLLASNLVLISGKNMGGTRK